MDEGNEDDVNRDNMINVVMRTMVVKMDLNMYMLISMSIRMIGVFGSEHVHVDFDEYQDDREGVFDIRSYRSESDHDSDIVCRICFPDVNLFV